jgi:hypothetical protein
MVHHISPHNIRLDLPLRYRKFPCPIPPYLNLHLVSKPLQWLEKNIFNNGMNVWRQYDHINPHMLQTRYVRTDVSPSIVPAVMTVGCYPAN